jgi:YD repeat-containing protein
MGGWRPGGARRVFAYEYDGQEHLVEVDRAEAGGWQMAVDGTTRAASIRRGAHGILVLRQGSAVLPFVVERVGDAIAVSYRGTVYRLTRPRRLVASGGASAQSDAAVTAPMPATVVKVAVQQGEHVSAQQPLMVLEAMKMEHVIHAPYDGVVEAILYQTGDLVPAGSPVVELKPA